MIGYWASIFPQRPRQPSGASGLPQFEPATLNRRTAPRRSSRRALRGGRRARLGKRRLKPTSRVFRGWRRLIRLWHATGHPHLKRELYRHFEPHHIRSWLVCSALFRLSYWRLMRAGASWGSRSTGVSALSPLGSRTAPNLSRCCSGSTPLRSGDNQGHRNQVDRRSCRRPRQVRHTDQPGCEHGVRTGSAPAVRPSTKQNAIAFELDGPLFRS